MTLYCKMAEFSPMQGNKHGDTKSFNDAEDLGIEPGTAKIVFVRVWYSEVVHGIRVDYSINGEIKKVKHKGDNCSDKPFDDLKIEPGDYIKYFWGLAGNIIDALTIRTKRGKEIACGGTGGRAFEFDIPEGQTIGTLAGGTNGDLHNISVMFAPIFSQPKKLPLVGAYHGDT